MEITISTRHGHISEETQAKIASKVEKLGRLFDRLTGIEVTIDLEHRDMPSIDLRVSAEHRHDFVATSQSEDLLASTDIAVRKLEQQVRRHKERVRDRHRNSAPRHEGMPSESEPAIE
ncbi:MAG: ribosome-associated translation inhibitor RaiA [Planctomycetota bacterium]